MKNLLKASAQIPINAIITLIYFIYELFKKDSE